MDQPPPSASITRPAVAPLAHVRAWLHAIPIRDGMDQRTAVFFQVLLLVVAADVIVTFLIQAAKFDFASSVVSAMALRYSLVGAPALLAMWVVRRGRPVLAARVFLGAWLLAVSAGYVETGMQALPSDFSPCFIMAIGAHVLGGRALWLIFGVITAAMVGAVITDQVRLGVDASMLLKGMASGGPRLLLFLATALVLEYTIVALRNEMQAAIAREAHLQDVSRRLREEIDRHLASQRQLVHAQRVESAGRIASGVAHDFGNLLNIISGHAQQRELLAEQGTDALLDALAGIELAAKRGQALNRRLLDFARHDAPVLERFDAVAALHAAQPLLAQVLGSDIALSINATDGPLLVRFDRAELDLIAINLASNARDAMAERGRFDITLQREGAWAALGFRDTGHGATPEELARFFEPFYTRKARGDGTGLGLSVVKSLVERAGGSISADATPHRGTTITLRLPLIDDSTGSTAVDACAPPPPPASA